MLAVYALPLLIALAATPSPAPTAAPTPVATSSPQPAPTASPAPAQSPTPSPFGYVVSPAPAQTGSPRIVEIALNDRVLHAGGMLLVRVMTSPDVTGVIARTWDHAITIPQGSPGYFAGQTQLPAGIPFFLLNRTYQIDFVASTADGRTVTYTLPVRLER